MSFILFNKCTYSEEHGITEKIGTTLSTLKDKIVQADQSSLGIGAKISDAASTVANVSESTGVTSMFSSFFSSISTAATNAFEMVAATPIGTATADTARQIKDEVSSLSSLSSSLPFSFLSFLLLCY